MYTSETAGWPTKGMDRIYVGQAFIPKSESIFGLVRFSTIEVEGLVLGYPLYTQVQVQGSEEYTESASCIWLAKYYYYTANTHTSL